MKIEGCETGPLRGDAGSLAVRERENGWRSAGRLCVGLCADFADDLAGSDLREGDIGR